VVRALGGLVLAALVLTACGGGGGAERTSSTSAPPVTATHPPTAVLPTTTTTAPPVVDRRTGVGVSHETFVDPTRGTSTGEPTRTFPMTIWYPTPGDPDAPAVPDAPPDRAVGAYPLVVFIHGYAVTPDFYEELLRRWASAGYVVAAATYPGGDDDYALQFADTTFLITQLLRLSGGAPGSNPLVGTIDANRVGVAGHSNGEAIAYGLGFLQCCRDQRVKSVIALAGILGNVNNPVQRNNSVPVLHIMGEADELQPYDEAIQWDRDNLTPPRWSVTLVGGAHAPPYRSPSSPHFDGVVTITTDFLDGTLKGHPEKLNALDAYVGENGNLFRVER
jgi:predicted dienelactone hydrolase